MTIKLSDEHLFSPPKSNKCLIMKIKPINGMTWDMFSLMITVTDHKIIIQYKLKLLHPKLMINNYK